MHHGHRDGTATAGNHAPDPDGLLRTDHTPVTVEELLARPGMLLLARCDDPATVNELRRTLGDLGTVVRIVHTAADEEPEDCVVDPDNAIGRHYGLGSAGLALIRPDGYLGLVADSADPDLLRRYLADILHIAERQAG